MKDKIQHRYPGGHWLVSIIFLPTALLSVFLCLFAAWLKFDFIVGRLIVLIIFGLILLFISKLITYTYFLDEKLRICYLFGNKKEVSYSQIRKIRLHQDGSFPINVFKIYYKLGSKLKTSTFYVKTYKREDLQKFFKDKGYNLPLDVE